MREASASEPSMKIGLGDAMVETFCGVKHLSFSLKWWLRDSINIDEALDCVDKDNHSGHEFGSIGKAVNL